MTLPNDAKRVISEHPARHDFSVKGDYVRAGTGDHPVVIDRHWTCSLCPTIRVDTINVVVWRLVSRHYEWDKNTTIEKATHEEWLRKQFLATSKLPPAVLKRLAKGSP